MAKKQKATRTVPKGAARELVEEGTHNAVCVQVIDVGTQESSNPEWEPQHQVYLVFQLVDEETSAGKPVLLSRPFNYVASSRSNLSKTLDAWLGVDAAEFDLDECLGEPCLVSVKHNETKKGVFANITSVTKPTKGSKIRKPSVDVFSLWLDEDFDEEIYEELSDFYKLKIASSDEGLAVLPKKATKGKKAKDEDDEEDHELSYARAKKGSAANKKQPAKKVAAKKTARKKK